MNSLATLFINGLSSMPGIAATASGHRASIFIVMRMPGSPEGPSFFDGSDAACGLAGVDAHGALLQRGRLEARAGLCKVCWTNHTDACPKGTQWLVKGVNEANSDDAVLLLFVEVAPLVDAPEAVSSNLLP